MKINRVADLPEWFSLESYEGSSKFTAVEWLAQIERRRDLLRTHPDYCPALPQNKGDEWDNFALEFWGLMIHQDAKLIRQAPLEAPTIELLQRWVTEPRSKPIRSVSLADLMKQKQRDIEAKGRNQTEPSTVARWEILHPDLNPIMGALHQACTPFYFDDYNGLKEAPMIKVDLGASDANLKEAFSNWLAETRKSQEAEKKKKVIYERWARYGILPYMDLYIWSLETGSIIPDRVYSSAISTYDAGEANLRKTVAPLSLSLLKDVSDLRAIAFIETSSKLEHS